MRLKPGALTIRDAITSEVPDFVDLLASPENPVSCLDEQSATERAALLRLIESGEPIERGDEMYAALLKYSQCFERCSIFKEDMAI